MVYGNSKLIVDLSACRYRVGEAFLHMPLPRALKRLERDQSDLEKRMALFSVSSSDCETQMKDLKVSLYAKFGSAINLDD